MAWWKWNGPTREYLLIGDDGVTVIDSAHDLPRGEHDTVGLTFPEAGKHPKVAEVLGLIPAPAPKQQTLF